MKIDFTNCKQLNKTYGGANGGKISISYENEVYMLKFPAYAKKNDNMSYANGTVSEYIGCHIFNMLGIKAQETILGTYKINDKVKLVVACKDFTPPGIVVQDFASLKNKVITSENSGYGTELDDVINAIEEQNSIDPQLLMEHFWNMFICDAFIGNWDRHNGNWGTLYNSYEDTVEIAPIFDCGSSLYPQVDERMAELIINDKGEMGTRIYNRPTSALLIEGRKINYFDFLSKCSNKDCIQAMKRIIPKINMDEINRMIDDIEYISPLMKNFYKSILNERKTKILDFSLNKIVERESGKNKKNNQIVHKDNTDKTRY